jgi:precorrin-2/cobalt-factor-2 C20-methyltransferase
MIIEESHNQIEVETIPGIGIVPALASRFGIALDKSFQVSDGSKEQALIRIKATRPRKLAEELRSQGYENFILGTRLYTPQENVIQGEMPEKSDYFSVLYARRRR